MDSKQRRGVKHTNMQIGLLVLVAILLTDAVTWAQVYVEPNTALLNEGDRTELLCRYNREINYCRIEIPGEKVLNLSPTWNKSPGFTYAGKGLEAGECGVSIDHVKGINNGQVKCSVGVEGEEFTGSMDLVVAIRPQQPIIELITRPDRDLYFAEGSQFRARCIVRDGRPAANITWLLDDYPTDKGVSHAEIVSSQNGIPNGNDNGLATTVQEIQWLLEAEDNNRKLICRSHHQTDRESVPPQEGAYTLHVRFRPVHKTDSVVYGLYLDHTALVNVTIRSNPAPFVEWSADGNIISQGQQNGRFSAYEPVPLGQDLYNVTLAIAGLTPEDTAKTYQLRASNALGNTDYQVRISSSSKPPLAGLDIGAIVGIVVAIAVLIIVVLLFVFAKVTNRWCFGEKSLKSPRPETSDTESADINAASTATTATTAAISEQQHLATKENNCNGKKSKGLVLFNAIFKRVHGLYGEKRRDANDAEQTRDTLETNAATAAAAADDNGSALQQTSVEGAVLVIDNEHNNAKNTNTTKNKEDKQLVYAELILKPSGTGDELSTKAPLKTTTTTTNIKPTTATTATIASESAGVTGKSATEYAEIVYVQKPNAEQSKQAV